MRRDFTALEKIIFVRADDEGRISFSRGAPMELEIQLWVLLDLEARGFLKREPGNIPLLPFLLTPIGMLVRHTLTYAMR
ncbi:MAG: hypothetical protein WCD79_14370 [Chthoniobacteraceae bacterium]